MSGKRLIVVPMKDPNKCKSRLSHNLSSELRRELALKLFKQSIRKLKAAVNKIERRIDLAVVTESVEIQDICKKDNITTIQSDKIGLSLSYYLNAAAQWAIEKGYHSMGVVPSDIANPKIKDLVSLLKYPISNKEIVICPAKDLGTNALLVCPPNALLFSFGKKSFLKHLRLAKQIRLNSVVLPLESIRFDVDVVEDLDALPIKYRPFLASASNE